MAFRRPLPTSSSGAKYAGMPAKPIDAELARQGGSIAPGPYLKALGSPTQSPGFLASMRTPQVPQAPSQPNGTPPADLAQLVASSRPNPFTRAASAAPTRQQSPFLSRFGRDPMRLRELALAAYRMQQQRGYGSPGDLRRIYRQDFR